MPYTDNPLIALPLAALLWGVWATLGLIGRRRRRG